MLVVVKVKNAQSFWYSMVSQKIHLAESALSLEIYISMHFIPVDANNMHHIIEVSIFIDIEFYNIDLVSMKNQGENCYYCN